MTNTEIWLNSTMFWGTLIAGVLMGVGLSWFWRRMLRWADQVSGAEEPKRERWEGLVSPPCTPFTPAARRPWIRTSSIFGSTEIPEPPEPMRWPCWPWPPMRANDEKEPDETRT